MPPFPRNFEAPKFDKYKGKGDPRDHVQEFYMVFLEVSQDEINLMCLFLQSLGGSAMQWFSRLLGGIKTFDDNSKIYCSSCT